MVTGGECVAGGVGFNLGLWDEGGRGGGGDGGGLAPSPCLSWIVISGRSGGGGIVGGGICGGGRGPGGERAECADGVGSSGGGHGQTGAGNASRSGGVAERSVAHIFIWCPFFTTAVQFLNVPDERKYL
ncbi:hypothetical protein OSTOST_09638, partial [Ostertagia ostertagi]